MVKKVNKKDILVIIETVLIIILLINSIIYMVIAKDLSDYINEGVCSNNEINSFIEKHVGYLAVFEIYEKMYD